VEFSPFFSIVVTSQPCTQYPIFNGIDVTIEKNRKNSLENSFSKNLVKFFYAFEDVNKVYMEYA